ncbi:MAG TPA: polysaccharide deacetylase, partial [Bacillota bacterium]|nr:polysaccharide deacetylase [Bacillota bacterium]
TEKKAAYVSDNTRPGSIILLHLMYSKEAEITDTLTRVVNSLKGQGYTFVTVDQLMQARSGVK